MTIDMRQFYQVFFDEAAEHLSQMESLLLGLDIGAPDLDDLNAIFRAAHSIKGGSGTFGFADMAEVTHILENLLDRLRKEEIPLRDEMIDAFLQAGDVLRAQLDAHQTGNAVEQEAVQRVCQRLEHLSGEASACATGVFLNPMSGGTNPQKNFAITYTPAPSVGRERIENVYAELRSIGRLAVLADGEEIRLHLATEADESEIHDIFSFIAEPDEFTVAATEPAPIPLGEESAYGFFDDFPGPAEDAAADPGYGFFEEQSHSPTDQREMENQQGYGFFGEIPPVSLPPLEQPPTLPEHAAPAPRTKPATGTGAADSNSIRVGVDKVDQLINLVGELVITQAMLTQTASTIDPLAYEKLLNGMAQLERNTRDLQEAVMSIRMMPISFVFSRFPRVVRELAAKLGKQVELRTHGEGTELDKGLIEKLADPLTHLVRNSLDHGIESPERRVELGKNPKGLIALRAEHLGGNIVIEVSDDGAGLNRERILAKASENGIPVPDKLPDHEVWQLIFAPGFSTADVVTDVSGRGVGMDVVKRNIHAMGGGIDIASAQGVGTRMTVRLPLTLAILDGLSIAVGQETYILPLTFIVESLQPEKKDIKSVSGEGRVVQVRGEYLPLVALHQMFGVTPRFSEPHQGILVLLEAEGKKIALFVDELAGQHQVVIKSLESNYRKVPGVSGATIMGDGRVALILDVAALVRMAQG